jgi:hypothetical protein
LVELGRRRFSSVSCSLFIFGFLYFLKTYCRERDFVKIAVHQYEESVVDKFKSNLLLMLFWLNIINYNY